MKKLGIGSGVACLALLMISLTNQTAAQLDSPAATAATQKNLQAARVERLRKAMSDANTLEFLAAQLKTEIAKSKPDTVSINVSRRAEEIEKLARKIRTESEQYRYF
jgi:ATP-dependent helicase/DNAse subunit B